jgi:hypothetical protein
VTALDITAAQSREQMRSYTISAPHIFDGIADLIDVLNP